MPEAFKKVPDLRAQDAVIPLAGPSADRQAPMLVEAEWPPLDERERAAGHVDFNLVRHLVTEVLDPHDADQAEWMVDSLLRAGREEPQEGRRSALLLALASRLADDAGWQVTPKPKQEGTED